MAGTMPGHDGERTWEPGRRCTPEFARCVDIPGMVSNGPTGVVPGLVPGIHVLCRPVWAPLVKS